MTTWGAGLLAAYGDLAVRYNNLRAWGRCMIVQHNAAEPKPCQ